MVTLEQKRLVRENLPAVAGLAEPIAKLFYGRLFEVAPEVRPMFKQDITVQGRKLMEMLTTLVGNLDRLDELNGMLRAMGQRHAGYGVRTEHYAFVSTSLIWALGVALDSEFSPELKGAWRQVIE